MAIRDNHANKQILVRVIDESGEDYLFPSDYFVPVALPKFVQGAMMRDAHGSNSPLGDNYPNALSRNSEMSFHYSPQSGGPSLWPKL